MAKKKIPAPLTPTIRTVNRVCGVVCLLGAALTVLVMSAETVQGGAEGGLIGGLVLQVAIGVMLVKEPNAIDSQRAQMLAERESAPLEAKSDYEEAAPVPDIVQISITTGILSLVSVVFIFAPVAMISGGIAISRRHPKGLIGVILGIVGIAGWTAIGLYAGQFDELFASQQVRMERQVRDSFIREKIMQPLEPVVELTQKQDGTWVGTATFAVEGSPAIYDIKVEGSTIWRTPRARARP